MKKTLIILITLLVIFGAVFINLISQPGEGPRASVSDVSGQTIAEANAQGNSLQVDKSRSEVTFTGFAPGKSHELTFDNWEGTLSSDSTSLISGFQGTIQASSVNTGIGGLDTHLKSDDFFDVEKYPVIEFNSASIKDGQMSGFLNFRGVTKAIQFPITTTQNSISADFFFDTEPFNFKYIGVNKEVQVKFTIFSQN